MSEADGELGIAPPHPGVLHGDAVEGHLGTLDVHKAELDAEVERHRLEQELLRIDESPESPHGRAVALDRETVETHDAEAPAVAAGQPDPVRTVAVCDLGQSRGDLGPVGVRAVDRQVLQKAIRQTAVDAADAAARRLIDRVLCRRGGGCIHDDQQQSGTPASRDNHRASHRPSDWETPSRHRFTGTFWIAS